MAESAGSDQADLQKLKQLEINRKQTEIKIKNFSATPAEAGEWYLSHDPLRERQLLKIRRIAKTHKGGLAALIQTKEEVQLNENAALILINSAFFPDSFENGVLKQDSIDDLRSYSPKLIYGLTEFIRQDEDISKHKLDPTGVNRLMMAGDMLERASRFLPTREVFVNFPSGLTRNGKTPLVDATEKDRYDLIGSALNLYYLSIMQANRGKYTRLMIDSYLSLITFGASFPETRPIGDENMLSLIDFLHHCFNSEAFWKMDQGILKGLLHETMWIIDFLMLDRVNPHKLLVRPARKFEDSPHVNHTDSSRAFDVKISDDFMVYFFQLKSSPRAARNQHSHPVIKTLIERKEDFSTDPLAIMEKLEFYRKFLTSDCPDNLKQEVKEYILPTVKQAVEEVSNERKATDGFFNDAIEKAGEMINREDRRQLGRRSRHRQGSSSYKKKNKKKR